MGRSVSLPGQPEPLSPLSVPSSLGMGRSAEAGRAGERPAGRFQSPLHWGWVVHSMASCQRTFVPSFSPLFIWDGSFIASPDVERYAAVVSQYSLFRGWVVYVHDRRIQGYW